MIFLRSTPLNLACAGPKSASSEPRAGPSTGPEAHGIIMHHSRRQGLIAHLRREVDSCREEAPCCQSAQAIASRTVARLVPFVTVFPAMATSTQILPTHCWNFFNSCKSASPRPRQWTVCDFWCICTGAASTKHAGDSDVSVASARLPVGLRRVRL